MDIIADDVLGEDDIMFNAVDGNIFNTFITIGHFHTISVFLNESESSFNSRSERFELLID